jgi:hypothetical protein
LSNFCSRRELLLECIGQFLVAFLVNFGSLFDVFIWLSSIVLKCIFQILQFSSTSCMGASNIDALN